MIIAIPRQGSMILRVSLDAQVTVSVAGIPISYSLPLTLEISNLRVVADIEIDNSDPTRPVVRRLAPPQAGFNIAITSTQAIAQNFLGYFNQVADVLVNLAINVALNALVVPSLPGYPGGSPGPTGRRR